ncbi:SDR family NAD(P)-dependent oxidoreductase [Streptomyces sp. NBC_00443]|uniref:SDR family NAD(P)-dependent oxidoreductase n=1 Tax=Streptomyces sp. NBC_00443 TaxID=2975743 RepID=UPI002E243A69
MDRVRSSSPVPQRLRLDGRRALVTGAGQGIGRALAHALADAGARVAVLDLVEERADSVVAELKDKGTDALALAADIAADDAATRYVAAVMDAWGGLDIAVNNAGINRAAPAETMSARDWDDVFAVNLRGVFLGCQAEARVMLPRESGRIVNIASAASLVVPHPQKQVAYNVAKAGVVHLTRTLAAEWADRGIRVNCISPGTVRTPLITNDDSLAPLVNQWIGQIPVGRLGEVTDLQAAVVYLASDACDYLTGHNLVIDGGATLW